MKFVDCKSALISGSLHTTDRPKAVVPVLFLLCLVYVILRGVLY